MQHHKIVEVIIFVYLCSAFIYFFLKIVLDKNLTGV